MKLRETLTATFITSAVGLTACTPTAEGPRPDPAQYRVRPEDTVQDVPELGTIGKWMVTKTLENATWLGDRHQGRTLREPVNVLLLDRVAKTPEEATARMLNAMNAAGYGPKNMHSDGYYGWIGDRLYAQHPTSGKGLAFSSGPWYTTNHHGRLFGPAKVSGGFLFTGAFSLEDFRLLPRPGHPYNSFQATRENLADQLTAKTTFKRAGYVDLQNALDTPTETTDNHDGKAVLLVAGQ